MDYSNNRILEAIAGWRQKEAQMKEAFGQDISEQRHFIHEKLSHFKKIDKTKPANLDEKFARKLLKGEIRDLEKKAYPNRTERLLRKTFEKLGNAGMYIYLKIRGLRAEPSGELNYSNFKKETRNEAGISQAEKEYKSRNKTVGRYSKDAGDDLLPKLRHNEGKGLKR